MIPKYELWIFENDMIYESTSYEYLALYELLILKCIYLYDSNLDKSIDSWTYVLYKKICNSHLYDSGLLYVFWVGGPTCITGKNCNCHLYDSILPSWPAENVIENDFDLRVHMVLRKHEAVLDYESSHYRTLSSLKDKGICMIFLIWFIEMIMILFKLSIWTVFIYVYVYNLLINGFSFTEWRLV